MFLEDKNNMIDMVFLIVGFGSQFMLLISFVIGERTLLASILCLMVPAIRAIIKYKEKYILFMFLTIAFLFPFTVYKIIIFFPFAVYVLYKIVRKTGKIFKLELVLLAILSVIIFQDIFIGYYKNSFIHKYNINTVKSAIVNHDLNEIVLKKYNDDYCTSNIYTNKYHLNWFKIYYNIPYTEIVFEED